MYTFKARPQAGSALLLMMTLLVMIFSAVLLNGWRGNGVRFPFWLADAKTLGQARQAVLASFALSSRDGGGLPCPDADFLGDGWGAPTCQPVAGMVVGWLPWRSLGLMPLKTAAGGAIGYAVAGDYLQSSPGSVAADGGGIKAAGAEWAAMLFVPLGQPRPGTPLPLAARLRDAQALPITVAELAALPGGDHGAQ